MVNNCEFNTDQEIQIDRVMEAAENLIRVLIKRPEYLANSTLKDYYEKGDELPPIHPSEVADHVADMLLYGPETPTMTNVFFPVRVMIDGEINISDTCNRPIHHK